MTSAVRSQTSCGAPSVVFGPPPAGPGPSWIIGDFKDDIWIASRLPATQKTLDFNSIPQPFRFLAKFFLWSLEYVTDRRIVNVKPITRTNTFVAYFLEFRFFVKAAYEMGFNKTGDIDETSVEKIFRLRLLKTQREDGRFSGASFRKAREFMEKLHRLGPSGLFILPDGISYLPDWRKIASDFPLAPQGKTLIMPDDLAEEVLRGALKFIEHASAITKLYKIDCAFRETQRHLNRQITAEAARLRRLNHIRSINMLEEAKVAMISLKPILRQCELDEYVYDPDVESIPPFCFGLTPLKHFHIIKLVHLLQGACYCVLGGFTGFRYSEIANLKKGDIRMNGACVSFTSPIIKTSGRSTGANVERVGPAVVYGAYDALVDLAITPEDNLWNHGDGRLTNLKLGAMLNRFLREYLNRTQWRLTSHQFRRYFAIFYVRRFQGDKESLQYHFRHCNLAMIEYYISDAAGAKYLVESNKALAADIFSSLLHDDGRYSKIGVVPGRKVLLHYQATNLPVEEIEREVRRQGVTSCREIRPTPWGYCMLQPESPEGAICAGPDGVPNAAHMYPENCTRCRHLAIGRENKEFWIATGKMHREIVDNHHSTPIIKEASEQMIEMAQMAISRLEQHQ